MSRYLVGLFWGIALGTGGTLLVLALLASAHQR